MGQTTYRAACHRHKIDTGLYIVQEPAGRACVDHLGIISLELFGSELMVLLSCSGGQLLIQLAS